MSSVRDFILMEYAGMPEGTVMSGQMCPSCKGGLSGEQSMSVGRTNGLLWWRCHRNSCSLRGAHGARVGVDESPAVHRAGRWNYTTSPLSKEWLEWLSYRFSIEEDIVDREWRWTGRYGGRVVMPIRNDRNITTGFSLRSYNGDSPKNLIHRVSEEVGHAWYRSSPYASRVLVVEDQPSALRASTLQGVDSIALLGTNFQESLVDRLRFVYRHQHKIMLALDQDATTEAVATVVKWKSSLPSLEVLPLDKDVKDQSPEEFRELFRRIRE